MKPEQVQLLRSIKREAIVLITMLLLNRPTGEGEIAETLGINLETARIHLKKLSSLGLCTRTSRFTGYILTGFGSQLILGPVAESAVNRGKPALESQSTTTALSTELNINRVVVVESATAENPRSTAENPRSLKILDALKEAGIGRNKRTDKLLAMEHITPEFIQGHAAALAGKNKGLLILRLENNEPVPVKDKPFDRSSPEALARYAEWEQHPGQDKKRRQRYAKVCER